MRRRGRQAHLSLHVNLVERSLTTLFVFPSAPTTGLEENFEENNSTSCLPRYYLPKKIRMAGSQCYYNIREIKSFSLSLHITRFGTPEKGKQNNGFFM
jgi:hypothetical protein